MPPTSYPGAIDAFVNPDGATDNLDDPPHDGQHADANDAIEAVETELGINPRGSFATVRARLDDLDVSRPLGVLDYVEKSSNTGSITTSDVTIVSVQIVVPANRRLKMTAGWQSVASTVADDRIELALVTDATDRAQQLHKVDAANNGQHGGSMIASFSSGAGGTIDFVFQAVRLSGTGTFTVIATADAPAFLLVEDIGPAA